MTAPIIPPGQIRKKGRAAFFAGKGRDAHEMNPGSPAIKDWQAGWTSGQASWAKSKPGRVAT